MFQCSHMALHCRIAALCTHLCFCVNSNLSCSSVRLQPEAGTRPLEYAVIQHRLTTAPALLAHEQKQVLSLDRFDFWPGCRGFKRVCLTRIGLAIEGES